MPHDQARLLMAAQAHHTDDAGQAKRSSRECRIRPSDEQAVRVFEELRWQWRTIAGMGGVQYLALDRNCFEPAMRWHGVAADRQREVLRSLGIMERAARKALHEAQAKPD